MHCLLELDVYEMGQVCITMCCLFQGAEMGQLCISCGLFRLDVYGLHWQPQTRMRNRLNVNLCVWSTETRWLVEVNNHRQGTEMGQVCICNHR